MGRLCFGAKRGQGKEKMVEFYESYEAVAWAIDLMGVDGYVALSDQRHVAEKNLKSREEDHIKF